MIYVKIAMSTFLGNVCEKLGYFKLHHLVTLPQTNLNINSNRFFDFRGTLSQQEQMSVG